MKYLIILLLFLIVTNQSISKEIIIPENNVIKFDIIRKNKNIGYHIIDFNKENDILNVNIEVNINVKIGFLSIYKYSHQNHEQWKDGKLYKIKTNTYTNSKKEYFVNGIQIKNSFECYGVDDKIIVESDIIPISYWNKEITNRKIFLDSQKGILREFNIDILGEEEIIFKNNKINTEKYELMVITKHITDEKPFPILYLWYTKDGELMKLKFDSPEDNSIIEYNRIQ